MIVPPLTREQVRQVDKIAVEQYGIPGIVLMENAGRGSADIIDRVAPKGLIAILAGPGNNGGDGYVIARHLELAGRDVRIVSVVDLDRLQGDAKINADIVIHSKLDLRVASNRHQFAECTLDASTLVDCLLGTGAQGPLRGLYAEAVAIINAHQGALRIAIDIPTGLDCDTGEANDPTFRADHTITFVAQKIGFKQNHAGKFVGVVHEVGIGVPVKLLRELNLS